MKMTTVTLQVDAEKLSAMRLYMAQKGAVLEDALVNAAEALYGKYVPANVREFIELRADTERSAAKRARPQPVSDRDSNHVE